MRKVIVFISLTFQGMSTLPALASHDAPEIYVQAGDDFVQKGRYKDAIAKYSKAIHLDKNNPKYYQFRANAESQVKKYKQAIADLSHSIKLNPNDPDAYAARAAAYEAIEEYKKEKSDLDALLSLRPNDGSSLLWRARLEKRLGRMHDVLEDCNKALYLGLSRDQTAELYKLRAEAYKKLGRKGDAEQELAKYQSLMP
jgi:tetratricopeptide (TPR) repeat protein